MPKSLILVALVAFFVGCSSEDASRTVQQAVSVVDETQETNSQGRVHNLQSWALGPKSARATVLGLGANVTVEANGTLQVRPIPSTEPTGRDVTPGWSYETQLAAIGRSGEWKSATSPTRLVRETTETLALVHGNATVRYTHLGYGLKQDIELATRPVGDGELQVAFGAEGGTLRAAEDHIAFEHGGAEVWRWQDLKVWDANGEELPSRMFVRDGAIVMGVDDSAATYPVTIDPLATTPSWSADRTGSSGNTNFGLKVRLAGDVDADGHDDILVAAPLARANFTNEGRVLLYLTPNGVPNAVADTSIVGGEANAFFGQDLAAAGDVDQDGNADIVIGSPNGQVNVSDEGIVNLYRGVSTGDGIDTIPAWTRGSGQTSASFGSAVNSGDFNCDGRPDLAIGAAFWDEGAANLAGKAWVFYADGTANFYDSTPWEVTGPAGGARLGARVDSAGNTNGDTNAGYDCDDLLIGASGYQPATNLATAGRLELYLGGSSGISVTPVFTTDGTQSSLFLGSTLAALGDTNGDGLDDIAIGLQRWDDAAGADQGAVFVHLGDATNGLVATPQRTLLGKRADDRFGFAVAGGDFNGDGLGDVAATAPLEDITVNANEGRASAWVGVQGTGIDANSSWTAAGQQTDSRFGFSIASGGDVNDDGIEDILVGAPLIDANMVVNAGQVYLYLGGQTCRINGTVYAAGDENPSNPCETCDPPSSATAWTSLADGTSCTDASVCGVNPTCQAGACIGTGTTCDDGDPCTIDTCDTNGVCQTTTAPDGTTCGTDADPCTTLECNSGTCDPVVLANGCSIGDTCYASGAVNPSNPCEVCDPATSTSAWSPAPVGSVCNDGLFCTVGETCDAGGTCGGGTARDCSSATDQCNNNPFCNEAAERCQGRPTNEGGTCDDMDLCTTNDVCATGLCVGDPVDCSNLTDECNDGLCGTDGNCTTLPKPDGTNCGTTAGEACFDGSCVEPIPTAMITGAATVPCNDSIQLDGTGSSDDRSLPLTYDWTQVSPMMPDFIGGATVDNEFLELNNDDCPATDTVVTIGLVVNNGFNESMQATFDVTFEAAADPMDNVVEVDMGMAPDAGEGDAGMADMGSTDDAGVTPDLGTGTDASTSIDGSLSGSGCGCASGNSTPTDAAPVLLLFLAAVVRRVRRR